jgi:hypothetical protein
MWFPWGPEHKSEVGLAHLLLSRNHHSVANLQVRSRGAGHLAALRATAEKVALPGGLQQVSGLEGYQHQCETERPVACNQQQRTLRDARFAYEQTAVQVFWQCTGV